MNEAASSSSFTVQTPSPFSVLGLSVTPPANSTQVFPSVVFVSVVFLYKLESNGKYGEGKHAGASILTRHNQYALLVYGADKRKLCICTIHPAFYFTVIENLYVAIIDDEKQMWSIVFQQESDLIEFCKHVILCMASSCSHPQLLRLDLSPVAQGSKRRATKGDTITLHYQCWAIDPKNALQPGMLFSTSLSSILHSKDHEAPVQVTLFSFAFNQAVEEAMIGMSPNTSRLILCPPLSELYSRPSTLNPAFPLDKVLLFHVTLLEIKERRGTGASPLGVSPVVSSMPDFSSTPNGLQRSHALSAGPANPPLTIDAATRARVSTAPLIKPAQPSLAETKPTASPPNSTSTTPRRSSARSAASENSQHSAQSASPRAEASSSSAAVSSPSQSTAPSLHPPAKELTQPTSPRAIATSTHRVSKRPISTASNTTSEANMSPSLQSAFAEVNDVIDQLIASASLKTDGSSSNRSTISLAEAPIPRPPSQITPVPPEIDLTNKITLFELSQQHQFHQTWKDSMGDIFSRLQDEIDRSTTYSGDEVLKIIKTTLKTYAHEKIPNLKENRPPPLDEVKRSLQESLEDAKEHEIVLKEREERVEDVMQNLKKKKEKMRQKNTHLERRFEELHSKLQSYYEKEHNLRLRETKVETLLEESKRREENSDHGSYNNFDLHGLTATPWIPDAQAKECFLCKTPFSFAKRRHHCRNCGGVFCNTCSSKRKMILAYGATPVRVCNTCHS